MIAWIAMTVLAQAYYSPDEARGLFTEANSAYARADYPKAREDYEKLVTHGQAGADVLYNLGTTALAMGDLGPAVLYLERARRAGDTPMTWTPICPWPAPSNSIKWWEPAQTSPSSSGWWRRRRTA